MSRSDKTLIKIEAKGTVRIEILVTGIKVEVKVVMEDNSFNTKVV